MVRIGSQYHFELDCQPLVGHPTRSLQRNRSRNLLLNTIIVVVSCNCTAFGGNHARASCHIALCFYTIQTVFTVYLMHYRVSWPSARISSSRNRAHVVLMPCLRLPFFAWLQKPVEQTISLVLLFTNASAASAGWICPTQTQIVTSTILWVRSPRRLNSFSSRIGNIETHYQSRRDMSGSTVLMPASLNP